MYFNGWTLYTPKDWLKYKEASGCEMVGEDMKLWCLYGPDGFIKFRPMVNKKTGKKSLYIETAYSISEKRDTTLQGWKYVNEIAKKMGADSIKMQTNRNPKVYERQFGFKVIKEETKYTMEIEL